MVNYIKGDLFKMVKPYSILAHACNCYGSWGGGIAAVFKMKFPSAYTLYQTHCDSYSSNRAELLGSCYLIPTIATDPGNRGTNGTQIIACLFTSLAGGDSPETIVSYTESAMDDLKKQLESQHPNLSQMGTSVHMPKINAGIFGVPWEMTEEVLEETDLDVNVYVID